MATYASYKKVATDSIVDGSLTADDLAPGARSSEVSEPSTIESVATFL